MRADGSFRRIFTAPGIKVILERAILNLRSPAQPSSMSLSDLSIKILAHCNVYFSGSGLRIQLCLGSNARAIEREDM